MPLSPALEHEIIDIYEFLRDGDFPMVPDDLNDGLEALHNVHNYVVRDKDGIAMWVALGDDESGESGFLDVAVRPDKRGRMATKGLLNEMYDIIFNEHKYSWVWCEPQNEQSRNTILGMGFKLVYNDTTYSNVYVFKPQDDVLNNGFLNG